jgi:hypothetical protein
LHSYELNTDIKKDKGGRIYFAHGFRRFSPCLRGLLPLHRTSCQWEHMEEEAVLLLVDKKPRERKTDRQTEREEREKERNL